MRYNSYRQNKEIGPESGHSNPLNFLPRRPSIPELAEEVTAAAGRVELVLLGFANLFLLLWPVTEAPCPLRTGPPRLLPSCATQVFMRAAFITDGRATAADGRATASGRSRVGSSSDSSSKPKAISAGAEDTAGFCKITSIPKRKKARVYTS